MINRKVWTVDERFQRCRTCGGRWGETALPGTHVAEGKAPSLETLCRGPMDLVTRLHDGETGAERERCVPLDRTG